MWRNSDHSWGRIDRSMHWLLALLIISQLVLGKIAEEAPRSPLKLELFIWHKSIGVSVLLLVVLRLFWRLVNSPPLPPVDIAAWEKKLARLGHIFLYLLMFTVPLSGWWASDTTRIPFKIFWLIPAPDLIPAHEQMHELAETVHGTLVWLFLALIVAHTAAALRHHFILHDRVLTRMLPWREGTR